MRLTKTEYVNRLCEIDPKYKEIKGKLYYMDVESLRKLYEREKNKNN